MIVREQPAFQALRRQYLFLFVGNVFETLHPGQTLLPGWHVDAICHRLEQVASGEIRRLLITVPPRHLKSICTAVALPAWLLGRDPSRRIMVASYGDALAGKHAADCRAVLETPWYRATFPRTRLRKTAVSDLQTDREGGRLAVSLGGAVTGFGADILIIDDLMKVADAPSPTERARVRDYYEQTLYSRLNDKQFGAIIAIQQRLHEEDLAAYLLEKEGFDHLNLPAIAVRDEVVPLCFGRRKVRRAGEALFPERESLATLEQLRKEVGEQTFSAQYQQEPVAPGGNRLRWDSVQFYDEAPARDELLMVVQSWDTACGTEQTANFSVCTTWGLRRDNAWLLLDVDRQRLDYPDLKARVLDLERRWRADRVIIERAATGIPLLAELRRKRPPVIYEPYLPRLDKQTRFDAQTGKIKAGEALLPRDAPWLGALRQELLAFPMGRHDDQVDSVAQFLHWSGNRRGHAITAKVLSGGERMRKPGRSVRASRNPLDLLGPAN